MNNGRSKETICNKNRSKANLWKEENKFSHPSLDSFLCITQLHFDFLGGNKTLPPFIKNLMPVVWARALVATSSSRTSSHSSGRQIMFTIVGPFDRLYRLLGKHAWNKLEVSDALGLVSSMKSYVENTFPRPF